MLLKEEQVSILSKDNFYYKQTNRELKLKLRELKSLSDSEKLELVREKTANQKLNEVNNALLQELQNLKSYLSRHHSANLQSVRKSLKDIKMIQENDILDSKGSRPTSVNSNYSFSSSSSTTTTNTTNTNTSNNNYPPPTPPLSRQSSGTSLTSSSSGTLRNKSPSPPPTNLFASPMQQHNECNREQDPDLD